MNASALLKSQGWRGEGHTLHSSNDSIGLKKRLAVSRNNVAESRGLGSSQYAQEQWWLSALSEQLSGLQSTPSGGVVQKVKDGKLDKLGEHASKSQLYKLFVRGGTLDGTVGELPKDEKGVKLEDPLKVESMDDIWRKPILGRIKLEDTDVTTSSSEATATRTETKEERRARREAKRKRKEARNLRREARAAEKQNLSATSSDTNGTAQAEGVREETKDERRARKEAKRKRREEKSKVRH